MIVFSATLVSVLSTLGAYRRDICGSGVDMLLVVSFIAIKTYGYELC